MNDREIMENILLTSKGICDLYMHGSIESATPTVHQCFNTALNNAIAMQSCVYEQMAQQGWYTNEQAPSQKLMQLKQKFCCPQG